MFNVGSFKITRKIVFLAIGTALFLGISISSVSVIMFMKKQKNEVAQLNEMLRNGYDTQIKEHTQIVLSVLENLNNYAVSEGLSKDSAELMAAKIIRNVKYGELGYFWADHSDGQNVFIINSSSEGTNRFTLKDAKGLLLVQEIIKVAKDGGGFTDYWWPKTKDGEPLPKRGYSAYYAPYDWIIGTGNYIDDIDHVLSKYVEESNKSIRSAISIQLIIGLILLVITSLIAIAIGHKVSKPVVRLSQGAKQIENGNLNTTFTAETADEVGQLADALSSMTKKLNKIVMNIVEGSKNIALTSAETSRASEQLSQGANEQASSIEEVSATMEQMSANIHQNTENARETKKVALEANNQMQEVSKKSQDAMIANRKIADKITIINDIAFQTNILALNAAVEAARAGEHGKGFAVVASEVRKLAERSKVAAEEIVALAQTGLELSKRASEVMTETIPKIEHTAELINEIAAASEEQNNGSMQVNNAIQQLNNITQLNAAASEELASGAEELSGQAEWLKDLVSFFTTDNLDQG